MKIKEPDNSWLWLPFILMLAWSLFWANNEILFLEKELAVSEQRRISAEAMADSALTLCEELLESVSYAFGDSTGVF